MSATPNNYDDKFWSDLSATTEAKLDLPPGMLHAIVNHGERSNNDQVSEAGARTPYQITPQTRKLAIDKWGVDPYLNPENAAEVAGNLLKDSLKRNKGDVAQAVGEYHGGTNRANWGPRTKKYIERVGSGIEAAQVEKISSEFGSWFAENKPATTDDTTQGFGKRPDGTEKGNGFLGVLKRPDGGVMTEYSVGVPINGQEMDIPTLVPTLNKDEIKTLLNLKDGESPPDEIVNKAIAFAEKRVAEGKPVFATIGESPDDKPEDKASAEFGSWLKNKQVAQPQQAAPEQPGIVDKLKEQNFGPEDSTIASAIVHPIEGVQRLGGLLENTVNIAAGLPNPAMQDEASMYAYGPNPEQQTAAAFNVAGLGQTGTIAPIVGQAAAKAVPAVANAVKEVVPPIVQGVQKIKQGIVGTPEVQVNPMSPQSGGAAYTPLTEQRIAAAQSLDVPIDLTRGEATRLPKYQKEEDTLARGPYSDDLHKAADEKNAKLYQNLDLIVDGTNATARSMEDFGFKVDSVLKKKIESTRTKIGAEYKKADNSPEAQLPVNLDKTIEVLNNREKWLPVEGDPLSIVKNQLIKLGAIKELTKKMDALNMTTHAPITTFVKHKQLTQKEVEKAVYQHLNANANITTRVERAKIRDIKEAINEDLTKLDGVSPLYAQARATNRKFIEDFESHKIVKDLTTKKLGTDDRKIAIEHIFNKSIIADNRSMEDIAHLKNTLTTGKHRREGLEVWKEIEGQFATHIKNQAFEKNNSTNALSEQTISPSALSKAIKKYDANGKLDLILGTQNAEKIRTIGEVANYVFTNPPKTTNPSGTAGQIAAMIDMVISGSLGIPAPALTLLKYTRDHINKVKTKKEIGKILNYSKNYRRDN